MQIAICGMEGSGNSTIAKKLGEKLNIPVYSSGGFRRKYAQEKGLTLEQLNELAKKDSHSDILVDDKMKALAASGEDFVLDAKLSFFVAPKAFKVWLTADEDERAKRIFKDKRHGEMNEEAQSIDDVKASIKKRRANDTARFKQLYNYERSPEQADLIVDTTSSDIESFIQQIIDAIEQKI